MTQRFLLLLTLAVVAAPSQMAAQSLRGTVVDRGTGAAVSGATLVLHDGEGRAVHRAMSDSLGQFTLPAAFRGFYTLETSTTAHTSLGYGYSVALTLPDSSDRLVVRLPSAETVATSMCDAPGGIVAGRVRATADSTATDAQVVVEWDEFGQARRSATAVTNAQGAFRVCGVPVGTSLQVRALANNALMASGRVHIPSGQRLASVELTMTGVALAPANKRTDIVLSGKVLDEKAKPIEGAEVLLPKTAKSTVTNQRGEFRLAGLAPGTQELAVRRIGYREYTEIVTVPADGGIERDYFLSSVNTLDTVSVTATVAIPSFEENRRIGLGKFLTRAELEKMENRKMSEILAEVGAATMQHGPKAWVTGTASRGPKSLGNQGREKCKILEGREYVTGGPACRCFALVYLNRALIFNGEGGKLVPDINSIVPASVEAIEFYKGAAQTPMMYSTLNSECGVLIIHTRRTPGSVLKPNP